MKRSIQPRYDKGAADHYVFISYKKVYFTYFTMHLLYHIVFTVFHSFDVMIKNSDFIILSSFIPASKNAFNFYSELKG